VTLAAHAAFVFASTDPDAGHRGIGCFRIDLDDPSVARQAFADPGLRPLGRGN